MTWLAACRRGEIPVDRGWPVRIGDRYIAIFDLNGELRAVENRCLHVNNPLDDGAVVDGCVTCPWHGWRYDLRTGEHLTMFGRRRGLKTYPVRVDGEEVLIYIDEAH